LPNRQTLKPEVYSAGLPAPLLRKKLHDAVSVVSSISIDFTDGHLDVSTPKALMQNMDSLAFQAVVAQACIVSASAGLRSSYGGTDKPTGPMGPGQVFSQNTYTDIRKGAFECLRTIGDLYTALIPAMKATTDSQKSWTPRLAEVSSSSCSSGKGYLNTFEDDRLTDPKERALAFASRLQTFLEMGGTFVDVIELREGFCSAPQKQDKPLPSFWTPTPRDSTAEAWQSPWERLVAGQWYDYVLALDNTIRLYPSGASSRLERPVCGHTLLAYTDPASASDFDDSPVIMAGDMCALKGSEGDLEALIVTNNSGHFKPKSVDLPNVLQALAKIGVPESKVCLFPGPNNLFSLRRELLRIEGFSIDGSSAFGSARLLDPYQMVKSWEG
jgi:hypothetical protein